MDVWVTIAPSAEFGFPCFEPYDLRMSLFDFLSAIFSFKFSYPVTILAWIEVNFKVRLVIWDLNVVISVVIVVFLSLRVVMTVVSFSIVSFDLLMILFTTVSLSGASSLSSETRICSFLAILVSFFLKFLIRILMAFCCSLMETVILWEVFCWILINSDCCWRSCSFSSARSNSFSVFPSLISLTSSSAFSSILIVSLVLFDSSSVSSLSTSARPDFSSSLIFSFST